MKRILVVSPDFPYPPTDGARADIWGRLQALKALGYTVEMIATVKSLPDDESLREIRKICSNVQIIERRRKWRSMLSLRPFQLISRLDLQNAPLSASYDAAILEGEYVTTILKNKSFDTRVRILRVHNDSARNFEQLAKSETSFLRCIFYRMEAAKSRAHFDEIVRAFDLFWFISNNEYQTFLHNHPGLAGASCFLPPSVDVQSLSQSPRRKPHALFIGTLGLAPNARAVEWYLNHVHASLADIPGYGLDIAGNTLGMSIDSIRKCASRYHNITISENPDSVADLYANASVFVNPVFHGTGVKLKTVHAIQAGLPVVTTTTGAEGTGLIDGRHLAIADSPDDFASAVRSLLLNETLSVKLVAESQNFLRMRYDQRKAISASLSSANLS